jgi:hypothetical protein
MKIISLNIRGLNGHSKQKLLWDIIKAEKLDIMMLQETKLATEEMDGFFPVCWKKGKGIYTSAMGATRCLELIWNPSLVTLENFFTTRWSISSTYQLISSNKPGYLTNFHRPATPRDKYAFLRNQCSPHTPP